jgi:Domain of Unknown Function (DUF928)
MRTSIISVNAALIIAVAVLPSVFPAVAFARNSTPNLAKSTRWQPPAGSNAGSTLSGGRRGSETTLCSLPAQPTKTLRLLVPLQPEGLLTTVAQPTFAWAIETAEAVPMTFILTDPQQAQPLYIQTLETSHNGIMSVTLPDNINLEPGTRYRWTVMVACGSQGSQVYARSFIQRVETIAVPQGSSLIQANAFAEQGIWYDALGVLLTGVAENPQDQELAIALESLLQNTKY